MAVRAPEFGLYVDVRLQRLAVNIAQPDLQVIEVGEDVRSGLNLVALVGDLVHAMPDILQQRRTASLKSISGGAACSGFSPSMSSMICLALPSFPVTDRPVETQV